MQPADFCSTFSTKMTEPKKLKTIINYGKRMMSNLRFEGRRFEGEGRKGLEGEKIRDESPTTSQVSETCAGLREGGEELKMKK